MIEVNKLSKTYERRRGKDSRVLRDVTVTLPDRGFVCILGPSGCGKTSLLNAIGGLDRFDSGSIGVDGKSFTRCGSRAFELERNRNFGYIFQNYYLLQSHTVAYNVYLGLHSLGLTHREKLERIRQALRAVDMERYLRRRVGELSGGQQQRVAIARALARKPRVIFADEPTGNLDEDNTRAVCSLLREASRDSLVVMVTHEERIARFFADRIITLSDGCVSGDLRDWDRGQLFSGSDRAIYAGDLQDTALEDGGAVKLRVLREEGAAPVELTVAVLRDRIVLKLNDSRSSSLGGAEDLPVINEGRRPAVKLEELDRERQAQSALFHSQESRLVRPGKGVTLPVMLREARELSRGRGLRQAGLRAFLVLLTVLTVLSVGDYLSLATINPEDFITHDSHILQLDFAHGASLAADDASLAALQRDFLTQLQTEAPSFAFVPFPSVRMSFVTTIFQQLESVTLSMPNAYSFAPIDALDPSTLIYGRMPQNGSELVVDRQVLEDVMNGGDNIIKNSISDLTFFLDVELKAESRRFRPVIVGICDSGEPTVYAGSQVLLSFRNGSLLVMSLSEAKRLYPEYVAADVTLGADECIINTTAAGSVYARQVGMVYQLRTSALMSLTIRDVAALPESEPSYVIVADGILDFIVINSVADSQILIYCQDKAAMKDYLRAHTGTFDGMTVTWSDPYARQYSAYENAAHLKADARSIITFTVIAVCLVMLFLLCRTQARSRIELLAVYRLLGIPRGKLHGIFLLESLISSLEAVLPSALAVWAAVAGVQRWTSVDLQIILPWTTALGTCLAILAYYLVITVLPLAWLLRLPPARLAAGYE